MKPYHRNPRRITKTRHARLTDTLERLGDLGGIVHNLETDEVIGGNQRMTVFKDGKPTVVEAYDQPDEQGTVGHGFIIWQGKKYAYRQVRWDEQTAAEANIAANLGAGDWDWDALSGWDAGDLQAWGFDGELLAGWQTDIGALRTMMDAENAPAGDDPGAQVDKAAELQAKWGTATGQMWLLDSGNGHEHRLVCGDCTDAAVVARVMGGEKAQAVVTDPPYCSGGFQESGKKAGSVGTRGDEMIANDTLSTRGYIALMKSALNMTPVGVLYVFTDWRMWINLFDVMESLGFGVRQMIVWDKGTPGMGRGWRSQHELIMAGMRVAQPFDPHKAQGNVIRCERTGNVNHATEKPVELIEKILDVTDMAEVVYDPFLGSGTTLIACERLGRRCRACEIEPGYVAVCLERFYQMTGVEPVLLEAA